MNTSYSEFIQSVKKHTLIPMIETFKTDSFTPVQLFSMFKKEAFCLLESHDEDSPWSRYSFIGLHPFLTIQEKENQLHIEDTLQGKRCTFLTLKEALQYVEYTYSVQKVIKHSLPFVGGAIGYISYDYSKLQMGLECVRSNAESFVHLLYGQHYIVYDHHLQQCMMIVYSYIPKNSDKKTIKKEYEKAKQSLHDYVKKLLKQTNEMPFILNIRKKEQFPSYISNYSKAKFMKDVTKIKEYICSGDVFQTVLSQRFTCETNCSGFELYRVLRRVNPSPYLFYLRYPSFELIGSSPERIIEVNQNQVEIHPIAGTRPRGKTKEQDEQLERELLHDKKEKAEHVMLVDLARSDLGSICEPGSVKVTDFMSVARFSHVMHLISKVTGTIHPTVHPIEALLKAAPAGTLSGAPKKRAMEIIEELEPTNRHIYGGTIAYIGFDGNIDSCIAIRTMKKEKNTVVIQAGAGVVLESNEESEYEETVNKAKALFETVALANAYFEHKGEDSIVSTIIK